jgi:hypothetical protein
VLRGIGKAIVSGKYPVASLLPGGEQLMVQITPRAYHVDEIYSDEAAFAAPSMLHQGYGRRQPVRRSISSTRRDHPSSIPPERRDGSMRNRSGSEAAR